MTNHVRSTRLALAVLLLAALPCAAQDALPGNVSLEERLAAEVRKMIDAGHLAPGISSFEQHFRYDVIGVGWELDDYWHNPAETVYTLSVAIPHLPEDLKAEAKDYLRAEFQRFPPTEFVHMGPEGAIREYADRPPVYASDWPSRYGQQTSSRTQADWPGWAFNPFNIYACYKYAQIFPDQAANILNSLRTKIPALPGDQEFLQARPHVVNVYIAGYFGFLGLQDLVGETRNETVKSRLDQALALRVQLLQAGAGELNGVEAGGFLWLVPELGDHLYRSSRSLVLDALKQYEWAAPYWFITNAQETSRFSSSRTFMEGYHAHIYDAISQFQARALALKLSRPELERYIDAPSVPRGDLYYIQNLCAAISAPSGGVRGARDRRYSIQDSPGQAQ